MMEILPGTRDNLLAVKETGTDQFVKAILWLILNWTKLFMVSR